MLSVPRRLARKYVSPELRKRVRDVQRAATGGGDAAGTGGPDRAEAEPLIAALREGRSLTAGLVAEIRSRITAGDFSGATAMSAALGKDASTAEVGDLCFGLVSFHRGFVEL